MTIHPIVTLGSEESQGGNDGTTCPDKSDKWGNVIKVTQRSLN